MRSETIYTSTETVRLVQKQAPRKSFCKMTLYKWGRLGKLIPTAKTAAGARLYTSSDVAKAVKLARKMGNNGNRKRS